MHVLLPLQPLESSALCPSCWRAHAHAKTLQRGELLAVRHARDMDLAAWVLVVCEKKTLLPGGTYFLFKNEKKCAGNLFKVEYCQHLFWKVKVNCILSLSS